MLRIIHLFILITLVYAQKSNSQINFTQPSLNNHPIFGEIINNAPIDSRNELLLGSYGGTSRYNGNVAAIFSNLGITSIHNSPGLIVEGNKELDYPAAIITGKSSLENPGDDRFLLLLDVDPDKRNMRAWSFRQAGTGAQTSLELKGISDYNFLISTTGRVGIGTASPRAKLEVAGEFQAHDFHQASSRRWKKDIKVLNQPLIKLNQIQGVSFQWKDNNRADIGFIAENIYHSIPEVVFLEDNGVDVRSVNYSKITALLVEAIKALNTQIDQLEKMIH